MKSSAVATQLRFLREFIAKPKSIGSVAPSSDVLARAMLNGHDLGRARTVVELGPGSGALTRHLVGRIGRRTRLVAVDNNWEFVKLLRRRLPQVEVIYGNAEDLPRILERIQLPAADVILSSLPWASFTPETQRRLLRAVLATLVPQGTFATYAYISLAWLPRARRFRRLLRSTFPYVDVSPTIWANFPPAFFYRCQK